MIKSKGLSLKWRFADGYPTTDDLPISITLLATIVLVGNINFFELLPVASKPSILPRIKWHAP